MKKALLFTMLLPILFIGCSKDDNPQPNPTTYTFKYEMTGESELITIDFTIFEYNDKDERVGFNSLNNVKKGQTKTFEANDNTEKVKVYLQMSAGTTESSKWVQQVYYLKKGSNIDIVIADNTMIGSLEP